MEVGKRQFSSNPLKYVKTAQNEDLVITNRGVPEYIVQVFSKVKSSINSRSNTSDLMPMQSKPNKNKA
jgi:hypothetical protein